MILYNMYLIIDTETTGLPKTKGFDKWFNPKKHEYYDSARLVQIAWKVLDKNFEEILSENYIVQRDDFSIENSSFHGITNEMTDSIGIPLDTIFEKLYTILLECEYIIAHNMAFDEHILLNHTYRIGDDHLRKRWTDMERICTMKHTKNILKLPKTSVCDCPQIKQFPWRIPPLANGSKNCSVRNALVSSHS